MWTLPMIGTIWEIVNNSAASLNWNCFKHVVSVLCIQILIINGMLKASELRFFLAIVDRHSNHRKVEGDNESKEP
jgi:hypothetical protein